jgi:hypothetical protein
MAYLTNIFKTFERLPAASDQDLQDWVTLNCAPRNVADYEDSHVNVIRAWMYALTGIPWYRAYEHGARPNAQYGTVHFSRVNELTSYSERVEYEQRENGDFCKIIKTPVEFVYILSVYRETGEATNQQEPTINDQPIFSAPDPLLQAKARAGLSIFQNALREYCLQYRDNPFGFITNLPQEITGRYEHRATTELRIIAFLTGSVRIVGAHEVNVNFCIKED